MKNYEYYGVFLSEAEKTKLLLASSSVITEHTSKSGWALNPRIYATHCTIMHRANSKSNEEFANILDMFLGCNVQFKVVGFGHSDKAIAALVDIPSFNTKSHITIAVAPDAKPVDSNKITDWTMLDEPFELIGTFQVICRS